MKFRHYKGGEYEFVSIAFRATGAIVNGGTADQHEVIEAMAVYRHVASDTIWTRPAVEFFGPQEQQAPGMHYLNYGPATPMRFTPLVPPKK
jgi:hypothetical protein